MAQKDNKAYMAKVTVGPRLDNSHGNTWVTEKLTKELKKPTTEMAIPLILVGNISENKVHITGPREMAKAATYSRIAMSTKVALT